MPLKMDSSRNVLLVFGCELVVVETGRYPSSEVDFKLPLKMNGSRNVLLVFGCELVVVETGRYSSSAVYLFN